MSNSFAVQPRFGAPDERSEFLRGNLDRPVHEFRDVVTPHETPVHVGHFLRQLERFAPLAVLVYVGNERPCVVPVVTPAAEDHPPSVTAPRVVAFHVVGVDLLHWTYLACT